MPETTVDTPAKLPSQATDRAEYQRIRKGEKIPVPTPDNESQSHQASDTAASGSAAETGSEASEASKTGTQDKPEGEKRGRSLEERIRELRTKGDHDKADKILRDHWTRQERDRADKLEQELQDLRTRKPGSETSAEPAKPAQPAAAAASGDDPEPKEDDFQTYREYIVAASRWAARQERRSAEQEALKQEDLKRRETIKQATQRKINDARGKYEDFDTVCAGDAKAGTGLILTPAMQQFAVESDAGFDVVYYLGKNPAERARIAQLSPARQLAELGKIEDKVSATRTEERLTEKPKPAVSKAAPPPPRLGGAETPAPKNSSEARDYREYKKLRHQR